MGNSDLSEQAMPELFTEHVPITAVPHSEKNKSSVFGTASKAILVEVAILLFYAAFEPFLIFLSILTLCHIALFTPFVLTGLFCDSDVTPSSKPNDRRCPPSEIKVRVGRHART